MNQLSIYDLNVKQVANLIYTVGKQRTVLIEGHMGSGKTSILKALAKKLPDHIPVYFDCTNKDLIDLGVPKVVRHENGNEYVTFPTNEELGLHLDKPVILMFDEIGKKKSIINAIRRVLLERSMGGKKLHPDSIVFATTNLGAENLGDLFPPHSRNAVTVCRMRKSTAQEWVDDFAIDAGVDPVVMAWVLEHPQVFQSFEEVEKPDADDTAGGNPYIYHPKAIGRTAFVTHRSAEAASDISLLRDKLDRLTFQAALIGTVGQRAASDLESYIKLADDLPTLQDIKENPKSAKLPASAAAVCMVIVRTLSTLDRSWMNAWMDYFERLDTEAQAMFALSARRKEYKHNEMVMTNAKYTTWCLNNQHLNAADKK